MHNVNGQLKVDDSGTSGNDLNITFNAGATGRPIVKLQQNATTNATVAVSAGASGHVVTGDSAGDLGITANSTNINFSGNLGTTLHGQMTSGGTWKNTSGTWSTLSDQRLKTNVQPLAGSLDKVMALRPVSFDWIEDNPSPLKPRAGFIAQEVEAVLPNVVSTGSAETVTVGGVQQTFDAVKSLSLGSEVIAHLVAAIQQLKAEFDAYKAAHP